MSEDGPDPTAAATTPYLPLFLRASGQKSGGRRRRSGRGAPRRDAGARRRAGLGLRAAPRRGGVRAAQRALRLHPCRARTDARRPRRLPRLLYRDRRSRRRRTAPRRARRRRPADQRRRPPRSQRFHLALDPRPRAAGRRGLDRRRFAAARADAARAAGDADPRRLRPARRFRRPHARAGQRQAALAGRAAALLGARRSTGRSPSWRSPATNRPPRRRSPKRSIARRKAAKGRRSAKSISSAPARATPTC